MKLHQLVQGSAEWHAHRATHFNASDATAMMGCSPYKTRTQLLHELHTGLTPEVDAGTQRRFDDGHRFEALARPLAEAIIEDDLYPVTGSEGELSASFDGLTMDYSIGFEHKSLNNELHNMQHFVGQELPLMYRIQMEQQLAVSGAERILFMASKWNGDELVEERHCWYAPDLELRSKIIAGWRQFASDLATFTPTAPTVQAVAAPVESLPAVQVSVSGQLAVISNLPEFGLALKAFIADIPIVPSTDNDFATCEAACKALKKAEDALDQAESYSLSQMTDVEEMRRTVANLRALARATRLASEKMVSGRKEQLRLEIMQAGRTALLEHVAALDARLGGKYMPIIGADFAGAIKGKRTIDSLHDAVNTTLANAKIEASATADRIQANLKTVSDNKEYAFLFFDLAQLVLKAPEDLAAVVQNRITEHKVKQEAERMRIASEERERAEAAANAKAAAELEAAREADRLQLARELNEKASAEAAASKAQAVKAIAKAAAPVYENKPQAKPVSVPTLKLGTIAERLGFGLTADFLSTLGFEPTRVKSAALYHESDFQRIGTALIDHINNVCELQTA